MGLRRAVAPRQNTHRCVEIRTALTELYPRDCCGRNADGLGNIRRRSVTASLRDKLPESAQT
tara:strand:- start:6183 stop:6368 length:186 start_codon:yes stop_codon:yes gene_type:complete